MPKVKGKFTLITGPMFSGKTSKLIAMVEVFTRMGYKVLALKPTIDNRYSLNPEIHSHDHRTANAIVVDHQATDQILAQVQQHQPDKVIIDEAQFFNPETIVNIITQLLSEGIDVYAAGIIFDYRRQPFGAMPALLGLANTHLELFSICQKCGGVATHSQRLTGNHQKIDIGASDKYIAVCSDCHSNY